MAFYYFIIYHKIGSVSSKLIIEEHLLYLQFACMASSVIYPLLCASMWRMEKSSVKEIVIISLSGIIFPLSWFAFFGIFSAVYGSIMYSSSKVIAISFIAVFCACCLFSIIALVRLFSFVVIKTEKYKLQRNLLIGIVSGFIRPFSGLVLNIIIPFPGNFQYPGIYLLTFINALVVIIPETKNRLCNICITAVRIILIPFIVYFFVILAPAFPFAFLLILLFGTGLIPLSPVFLLIIHISKLRKDYFQY